jgi:hypothetical protein
MSWTVDSLGRHHVRDGAIDACIWAGPKSMQLNGKKAIQVFRVLVCLRSIFGSGVVVVAYQEHPRLDAAMAAANNVMMGGRDVGT